MQERVISFTIGIIIGVILCFGYFTFFKSGPAGFPGGNSGFRGGPGMMRESGSGSFERGTGRMGSGSVNTQSQTQTN